MTGFDPGFVQRSPKDVWRTPPELYEPFDALLPDGLTLDPCADRDVQFTLDYYTGEHPDADPDDPHAVDGLAESWHGNVWVNPPFSVKTTWLRKAVAEHLMGNAEVIMVVTPDSTDVMEWWHGYIRGYADYTWFPAGRVNYIDPGTGEQVSGVPFGTAVSIYGSPGDRLLNYLYHSGDLVVRVQNGGAPPTAAVADADGG